jgi:hypothetical protein
MKTLLALASKVALAGAWARDMLVLGVTVPLTEDQQQPVFVEGLEVNPFTGLPMIDAAVDVHGNPFGYIPTHTDSFRG